MDTKEKYGISKRHAIMLFVQMILCIIGFLAQVGIFVFILINKLNSFMLMSSMSIILSFLAIFLYAIIGYKKENKIYYSISIGLYLFAVLMNNILPFRDTFQRITLTLLFGVMFAYNFTQDRFRLSNMLILVSSILSLAFSIYSAITADVDSLGSVESNILPVIMMYTSIFTPIIITGLFGITNLVREEKRQ